MEHNKSAVIFLADGRDGDFSSSGGAQSQRAHGECGGGADRTDQLSGSEMLRTHWTALFLLLMNLFFSHCTYSVIKDAFFKQSLPVPLPSLHFLEAPTLFSVIYSRINQCHSNLLL